MLRGSNIAYADGSIARVQLCCSQPVRDADEALRSVDVTRQGPDLYDTCIPKVKIFVTVRGCVSLIQKARVLSGHHPTSLLVVHSCIANYTSSKRNRAASLVTAVVAEEVGRTSANTGEDVLRGHLDDGLLHIPRGRYNGASADQTSRTETCPRNAVPTRGVRGGVLGHDARNVRRGHGGTRDGVRGVLAADPGGGDGASRREDIDTLAVVAEVAALVLVGGGARGDNVVRRGGRGVARVLVLVASSDGDGNCKGAHTYTWSQLEMGKSRPRITDHQR